MNVQLGLCKRHQTNTKMRLVRQSAKCNQHGLGLFQWTQFASYTKPLVMVCIFPFISYQIRKIEMNEYLIFLRCH